jgi:microcystin-dependent protein
VTIVSEPFIAEIRIYPYNFAPRNWAFCQGQLLAISQNTALFSLLGTTFGGNGQTTFGLPDLQGRVGVHVGQGPGLSHYDLGQVGGTETVTLTTGQLAPHPHPASCLNANGNQYQPQAGVWAVDAAQNPQYGATKAAGTMAPNVIGPSGNTQSHNNIQPYLTLNYCIALQGIYPSRP